MMDRPVALSDVQRTFAGLLATLQPAELAPALPLAVLIVDGQPLAMPYRVYCDPALLRSVVARSDGPARSLALGLGTRHWDGHVREECARLLLPSRDPWTPAFVVCLLGEYVIEIIGAIAEAFDQLDADAFAEFARANPAFMATARRRATSYWNEHHRHRFPDKRAYPGLTLLDRIEGR